MNQEKPFFYDAEVEWSGDRKVNLRLPDVRPLEVVPPPEFNGPAAGLTPEALYVGNVAACFMLTFLAIAERSRLAVVSASVSAIGKLEIADAKTYCFTEVTLKPTVIVEHIEDLERAERLLEKAERGCFIARSITSRIVLIPRVYHRQTPSYPCPTVKIGSAEAVCKNPKDSPAAAVNG
jgi:peroxiredoxin-like protein